MYEIYILRRIFIIYFFFFRKLNLKKKKLYMRTFYVLKLFSNKSDRYVGCFQNEIFRKYLSLFWRNRRKSLIIQARYFYLISDTHDRCRKTIPEYISVSISICHYEFIFFRRLSIEMLSVDLYPSSRSKTSTVC